MCGAWRELARGARRARKKVSVGQHRSDAGDAGVDRRPSTVHEAVAAVRRRGREARRGGGGLDAAAALELSGWTGGADGGARSKIRTMDAAQDRLLAEIDAATGELERLDAELDATEGGRGPRCVARGGAGGCLAAAMKTDRLAVLTEQSEWEREAAEAAAARRGKAPRTALGVAASAPATPAKDSGVQDGDEGSRARGRGENRVGLRVVALTGARAGRPPRPVKLAADIFAGSDLGRAYHPAAGVHRGAVAAPAERETAT